MNKFSIFCQLVRLDLEIYNIWNFIIIKDKFVLLYHYYFAPNMFASIILMVPLPTLDRQTLDATSPTQTNTKHYKPQTCRLSCLVLDCLGFVVSSVCMSRVCDGTPPPLIKEIIEFKHQNQRFHIKKILVSKFHFLKSELKKSGFFCFYIFKPCILYILYSCIHR